MAFAQNSSQQSAVELRPNDRLTLGLIGMGVIFASLGLGEAVYRFAFFDFDGASDRLPLRDLRDCYSSEIERQGCVAFVNGIIAGAKGTTIQRG